MSPKMPVRKAWVEVDSEGRECKVDILIENSSDPSKYPDGKKCLFRVLREVRPGTQEFELVLLIDNHEPYGYHSHDKFPGRHDSRESIHTKSWQEAWAEFNKKLVEIKDDKT